jgi:O-antigen/teichoic acid export membrane protein
MKKKIYYFLKKLHDESIFRNSIYLLLSNVIMTGLGFIFWIINARLYTSSDVGLATTIISAASLIVSISSLGMGIALIKYLPLSKNKNRKINSAITTVLLFNIVISSIFLFGLKLFSPKLIFLKENIIYAIIFMVSLLLLNLFLVNNIVD